MNKSRGLIGLVAMPLVLLLCLLVFVGIVAEEEANACAPLTDTGVLPAVSLDPSTVPKGPIAGYSGEQLVNAAYIMKAASDLGLSRRDQQIGVMTAMGESGLRVLDHGDQAGTDSRGLFQQRDNGAWGSLADRMDPYISSSNFFESLATILERDTLEPTIVANRVQGNADPYHYRPYWGPATQVVDELSGTSTSSTVVPAVDTTTATTYNLGPVQQQLTDLVNVLAPKFSITTVGGYRASATDPNGHPAGLAADFMVPVSTLGRAQGNALASYAMANATALKVDYILWQQRIWSAGRAAEGWRPMEDRGSPTENHVDHVHINVLPTGAAVPTSGAPTTDQAAAQACITDVSISSGSWVAPLDAPISSPYGPRTHPVTGAASFHDGVDYDAACDAPAAAASGGVVVKAGPDTIYGHQIIIDHGGGIMTRYGHMYATGVLVSVGDQVTTGQIIAQVGSDGVSTGCHLHFTVEVDGQTVNPVEFLANPPATGGLGDGIAIAHANIKASLSVPDFRADLATTVAGAPDLVSLNEMSPRSDAELAPAGYAAYRAAPTDPASQTRSTAVLWRTDRWRLVEGGRELLVAAGPQKWDAGRSATWATVANADGGQVSMISVHHMINPAVYGPNPRRQEIYAQGMQVLQALVSTLSMRGPVFVAGDFNSQWAANDPWGPRALLGGIGMATTMDGAGRQATHQGGGTIDYIFFQPTQATMTGQQITGLNSDHNSMLAIFQG